MTDAVNSQDLGYTLDIVTADSDALVFQYTLSKAYDMSDDADADALTQLYDAIFDSYASTFSSLRAQIADETGINGIAHPADRLKSGRNRSVFQRLYRIACRYLW